MLLTDSTEELQPQTWSNDEEKELAEQLKKITREVGEKNGLGCITEAHPESYYRLLCFTISYKTGTSLYHIMHKFTLFDFVSYLYIVNKFSEEQAPDSPTPEQKDNEFLGMV